MLTIYLVHLYVFTCLNLHKYVDLSATDLPTLSCEVLFFLLLNLLAPEFIEDWNVHTFINDVLAVVDLCVCVCGVDLMYMFLLHIFISHINSFLYYKMCSQGAVGWC